MPKYRFSLTGFLQVRKSPYSVIFYTVHINANEDPNLFAAGNYMFKFNNKNTRIRCGICSKLTLLLTLNIFHTLI